MALTAAPRRTRPRIVLEKAHLTRCSMEDTALKSLTHLRSLGTQVSALPCRLSGHLTSHRELPTLGGGMLPQGGAGSRGFWVSGGFVEKRCRDVKCFQATQHLSHNFVRGLSFVQCNRPRLKSCTSLGRRGVCSGAGGAFDNCYSKKMCLSCALFRVAVILLPPRGAEEKFHPAPFQSRTPALSANSLLQTHKAL